MTKVEREQGIAPDRISDVAEWADRPVHGKDIRDLTPAEIKRAEKLRAQLPPLPHTKERP